MNPKLWGTVRDIVAFVPVEPQAKGISTSCTKHIPGAGSCLGFSAALWVCQSLSATALGVAMRPGKLCRAGSLLQTEHECVKGETIFVLRLVLVQLC